MARGVNKVILVGNLGRDPEVRYMPSGQAIANVTIATTESWKDKTSGEKQERTEWHRVTFYGRLAEIAGEYLRKGSQVYVEGSLRTDKYQDKQTGEDKYSTKIVASDMQMLGGRAGAGTGAQPMDDYGDAPSGMSSAPPSRPASRPAQQPAYQSSNAGSNKLDDFDDDIPF